MIDCPLPPIIDQSLPPNFQQEGHLKFLIEDQGWAWKDDCPPHTTDKYLN